MLATVVVLLYPLSQIGRSQTQLALSIDASIKHTLTIAVIVLTTGVRIMSTLSFPLASL